MRVFLDTEFTCLARPQLISIGLVSEDGREFYRELKDTWTLAGCSLFVLGWVLPLLSEGEAGKVLSRRLQSTLDLIRYETASGSCQLSEQQEVVLKHQFEADQGLMDHLRLLTGNDSSGLYVREDSYLATPLRGLRADSILTGEQMQTRSQVAEDLEAWLGGCDGEITICVDSFYDKEMFRSLIERRFKFERVPNLADHGEELRVHHALDDARALRRGYLTEFG